MRAARGGLLLGLLLLGGCTSYTRAIHETVEALNARHDKACIYVRGMYPPFITIDAIIFTGGATIATCHGQATSAWSTQRDAPLLAPLNPDMK